MSIPSLSNFAAELRTRNVSRPNLYYAEIIAPGLETSQPNSLVSMWCSSAHTPQTAISTNDSYIEAGTRRKYAYDVDFQNLVLTFYIDQDYKIKQFFDDWKQKIVPYNRQFNYPDKYTAEKLTLYILDQTGEPTYMYEYSRVFPKTIQSVELSYANGTSISTFTVEFVFEDVYYTSLIETENSKSDINSTSKPPSQIQLDKIQNITNLELTRSLNAKSRN
jgi:hypothetical protein